MGASGVLLSGQRLCPATIKRQSGLLYQRWDESPVPRHFEPFQRSTGRYGHGVGQTSAVRRGERGGVSYQGREHGLSSEHVRRVLRDPGPFPYPPDAVGAGVEAMAGGSPGGRGGGLAGGRGGGNPLCWGKVRRKALRYPRGADGFYGLGESKTQRE